MRFISSPVATLRGEIRVAGDKSISHRSIIFGAIAQGSTYVQGLLEGEDVLATINAFRQMGVEIKRLGEGSYALEGVGLYGLSPPSAALDMGNSGTAFRLIAGLLSAQRWPSMLIGDESLCARPMGRIITPLTRMGARVSATGGKPPLTIAPTDELIGIHYDMPVASAQVKSCILLAGLYAGGETTVKEFAPTRDHTERMLKGFGYPVNTKRGEVSINGGGRLLGCEIDIPCDLSSATFFIVAGLIVPDSELLLENVGINPTRNGVLNVLARMGARIDLVNRTVAGGEPVADLVVKTSSLTGCDIRGDDVALSIDEFPAIAVAAACAEGMTTIREAEELRVKESDRISSVVNGLKSLGVSVTEYPDGMDIAGGGIDGGQVDSYGDHRIAMAFSIAGAVAKEPIEILNCKNVATSFPNFTRLAEQAGLNIHVS